MNEQTKKDILTWAQKELASWTSAHDDWWGAYNDEWDINIFDADLYSTNKRYRGKMCVTAYRMSPDAQGFLTTDMADFVRLGACERPGHLVWPKADGYADEVTA